MVLADGNGEVSSLEQRPLTIGRAWRCVDLGCWKHSPKDDEGLLTGFRDSSLFMHVQWVGGQMLYTPTLSLVRRTAAIIRRCRVIRTRQHASWEGTVRQVF